MKNAMYLLAAFLFFFSCTNNDDDFFPEGTAGTPSTIDPYDPNTINPTDKPVNLLTGGGFEGDGINDWSFCGNATLVSDEVYEGNKALVLENNSDNFCTDPFFIDGLGARATIKLPALDPDITLYTLSYRVKLYSGELADNINVSVSLSDRSDIENDFGKFFIGAYKGTSGADKWQRHQDIIDTNSPWWSLDINEDIYLGFEVDDENGNKIKIAIDDVQWYPAQHVSCPSPMEEDYLQDLGDQSMVFLNFSDEALATVNGDGTNLINYPTEVFSTVLVPRWYDKDHIVYPRKLFYPSLPEDPATVPGAGTDLYKYNIRTGQEEKIYSTIGNPGKYYFSGSLDNTYALDVEIFSAAWDLPRNRGVLTICARNRSPEFVTDDYCEMTIIDATTYEVIVDGIEGGNASWSDDGRLAYYWSNELFVASINGSTVNSQKVYTNPGIGGMLTTCTISPDGKYLIFAEQTSGYSIVEGEAYPFYTIKRLNLESEEINVLLDVDFGSLYTNLEWTPDPNYITYTLKVNEGNAEIWWLNINTGTTGPITNSVSGCYGSFE